MEAELKTLEDKLTQFVEVNQRLRDDTQRLRQELASALHRNKQLEEAATAMQTRVEMVDVRAARATRAAQAGPAPTFVDCQPVVGDMTCL